MSLTISKAVKNLLISDPFYGLFLLNIEKYFDDTIPTACVRRRGINIDLAINKKFWESLSDTEELSILMHEVMHLCMDHMGTSFAKFPNKKHLNVSQDAEINSYIPGLPKGCVKAERFGLEPRKGTQYYYENIPESEDDNFISIDEHTWDDWWDKLSDAEKKLIKNQIDSIAKQAAEQVKRQHGNIPAGLTEYIDSLFKEREPVFNWKAYFRRVVGNSIKSFIKSTRYRPSFRFKGQPGKMLKFKPKILVAVDTSGSVSNNELQDFFTEINYLHKSGVTVDVVEFDTEIQNKFEYTGKKTNIKIVGRGGTDVHSTWDYYKEHKEYSSLVVFTDGYLDINLTSAKNTIWVITSNGAHQDYPGISIYIPNGVNNKRD